MKEHFPVSYLSRQDLETKGFDTTHLSDDDMKRIASMMDDSYLDNGFWEDIVNAAEEYGVPRKDV